MEKQRIEKFVGQLVRVDLEYGQNLQGELRASISSPGQFELVDCREHVLFWPDDVADIVPLHRAEAEGMKRECTCTEDDPMSWTTCPRHSFEGQ